MNFGNLFADVSNLSIKLDFRDDVNHIELRDGIKILQLKNESSIKLNSSEDHFDPEVDDPKYHDILELSLFY